MRIGSFIDKGFAQLLSKYSSNIWQNVELVKAIYRARVNEERYENACDDLNTLSAVGYNENLNLPGNHYTWLKVGYNVIIQYLSSKISKSSIRLNELVQTINWSSKTNKITTISQIDQTQKTYTSTYDYLVRLLLKLTTHPYKQIRTKAISSLETSLKSSFMNIKKVIKDIWNEIGNNFCVENVEKLKIQLEVIVEKGSL